MCYTKHCYSYESTKTRHFQHLKEHLEEWYIETPNHNTQQNEVNTVIKVKTKCNRNPVKRSNWSSPRETLSSNTKLLKPGPYWAECHDQQGPKRTNLPPWISRWVTLEWQKQSQRLAVVYNPSLEKLYTELTCPDCTAPGRCYLWMMIVHYSSTINKHIMTISQLLHRAFRSLLVSCFFSSEEM